MAPHLEQVSGVIMNLSRPRRMPALALLLAVLIPSRVDAAGDVALNGGAYVLVDLSASYFHPSTMNVMDSTLSQVNEILLELVGKWPSPFSFHFLPIGEAGLTSPALCEGVFRSSLFKRNRAAAEDGTRLLHDRDELARHLDNCKILILNQAPRQLTDISGSIDLAQRMSRAQSRGPKTLIIISDFAEDRSPEAYSGELDLNGFSVIMIYRLQSASPKQQREIDRNLKHWSQNFRKAGAKGVSSILESGPFVNFVLREILE
ncbi:MAG: hypothetical protein JJ855_00285 [Rhodospirillales bacterium]|nr:hypothetical protein [Rhodospirillales bacterium]